MVADIGGLSGLKGLRPRFSLSGSGRLRSISFVPIRFASQFVLLVGPSIGEALLALSDEAILAGKTLRSIGYYPTSKDILSAVYTGDHDRAPFMGPAGVRSDDRRACVQETPAFAHVLLSERRGARVLEHHL